MPKRFLAILAALLLWSSLAFARLDINTATAEQLDGLKGIGPVKARAIVDYRRQHGPFRSVDDLQNVPGLGPAIVNGFRREVTIGAVAGEGRERPAAKPAASHPAEQRPVPAPARPAMPARPAAEKASSPTGLPPAPARPAGAAPLPAPAQPAKAPAAPAKPAVPAQPAALARPASPASPASPATPATPATPAGVPPVAAPARPAMPPRPAPAVN